MATRTTKNSRKPRGGDAENVRRDPLLDEPTDEEIRSLTDEAGIAADNRGAEREPEGAIRRYDPVAGKFMYLDTVPSLQVDNEWIANAYGGGKYRMLIRGWKDGKWQYVGNETFEVDESLPFKGSLRAQNLKTRAATLHEPDGRIIGQRNGASDDLLNAGLLSLMRERDTQAEQSKQMFISMMEESRKSSAALMAMMMEGAKAKPSVDWVALIAAVAPIVPQVMAAMQRKDAVTLEQIAALIRESKPATETQKLDDMLNLVAKLKDVAGGGDEEGKSGVFDKIMDVVPLLLTRVASAPAASVPAPASARAEMAAPSAPAAIVGAAPVPSPSAPEGIDVTAENVWAFIEASVPKLLLAASMGRSARWAAMTTVEMATPAQRALLSEVLSEPTFREELSKRFPELQKRAKWVSDYIDLLEDEVLGPVDDDEDDDAVAGAGDAVGGGEKS